MRRTVMRLGAILCASGWALHARGLPGRPAAPVPTPAPSPSDNWRVPRQTAGSIDIPRSGTAGHFFVYGDVAGRPLRLMVDTGASTVVLSRRTRARRAWTWITLPMTVGQ